MSAPHTCADQLRLGLLQMVGRGAGRTVEALGNVLVGSPARAIVVAEFERDRDGLVLALDTPERFLASTGTDDMESAFLALLNDSPESTDPDPETGDTASTAPRPTGSDDQLEVSPSPRPGCVGRSRSRAGSSGPCGATVEPSDS